MKSSFVRFFFLLFFLLTASNAEEFSVDNIIDGIESVDENIGPNPYNLSFSFSSEGAPSAADVDNRVMYNIPSFYVSFEKERSSYMYQWYAGFGYGIKKTVFLGDNRDKISAYTFNVGLAVRRYFFSDGDDGWYPVLGVNHKSAREFHNITKPDGTKAIQKYRYSFFSSFLGAGYTFAVKSLHLKSSIELKRFFKNRDFRNLAVFIKLEIGY